MIVAVEKLVPLYSLVLACLYCYFIASRIPKGFFRLISVLPLIYFFTILLHIPSLIFWLTSALFLTSLADHALSSSSSSNSDPKERSLISSYLALEVLLAVILISLLIGYKDEFHPIIFLVINCCLALLAVDCLGAASNLVLHSTVGRELKPPSDKPYLSTSLQDFWGKRWNLTVTNTLRRTVYRPVRSASGVLLGNRLAGFAAVLATFLVSGLLHELMLYHLTRAKPSWEMTSFFVLHGFCVALEVGVKKALNGRWGLPEFVSVPLTIGFMMLTGFWLFFSPLIKSGVHEIVLEDLRNLAEFAQNEPLIVGVGIISLLFLHICFE